MSVFHENMLIGASGQGAAGPTAGRSIRLNSADSARLTRSFSSSDRRTWTLSCWVKRCKFDASNPTFTIFSRVNGAAYVNIGFANDYLKFADYDGANDIVIRYTQAFYRDPASWYHVVVVLDTTNATQDDRARLYVNGSRITAFASANSITLNAQGQANSSGTHEIGRDTVDNVYSDGYLALVHFISGQALTPSSFGETSATTGQWIAKTYSGSYGTNGFFLDFLDNSGATSTTLGKDAAGSNNWTPNNLSVTAGSGNDSLRDHPTSAGTSTGAGGEVSGNYCTLNPLAITNLPATPSNGNLETTGNRNSYGTIALPSSGKWYWEVTPTAGTDPMIGMAAYDSTTNSAILQTSVFYYINGNKYITGTGTAYGASYALNDVIGVAANIDAGTVTFYKNNTSQGAITFNAAGLFPASTTGGGSATYTFNFGQRAFAYTAPSGFSPLVDTLLPTPTIAKPNTVMDVVLYTGNATNNRSVSGFSFSPDFVWIKSRSAATNHALYDTVRGAGLRLISNSTDAEADQTVGGLKSFTSDGFTLGINTTENGNGASLVSWAWDAGSSNATNTSGTITSTVRANISAGFSIVTYQGNGNTTASFGHGLGVTPHMVIIKSRATPAASWIVWHRSASAANDHYLVLNTTAAVATNSVLFQNVSSSVVTIGSADNVNTTVSPGNVAYCWTPVAGYSAFGSYTGNGSTDGPFVYTGFRPAVVLVKMSSSTGNWTILDDKREGYNVDNDPLYPNLGSVEGTTDLIDITSNGFKVRTTDATFNTNAGTYIYAAWASAPFPYARAR